MRLVLNLLWLVLSGFWMFLVYMVVGVLWCLTIVGIPFGIASFRIGLFGKDVVSTDRVDAAVANATVVGPRA